MAELDDLEAEALEGELENIPMAGMAPIAAAAQPAPVAAAATGNSEEAQ